MQEIKEGMEDAFGEELGVVVCAGGGYTLRRRCSFVCTSLDLVFLDP
jgi:hypothetical protein